MGTAGGSGPGRGRDTGAPPPRAGAFRVHGRRFEGQLCAPTRNDTESQDYDDRPTALYYGQALAELGYRVWVYERGECSPMDQPRWTAVAEWESGGVRIG